jgi:hypothetical protein
MYPKNKNNDDTTNDNKKRRTSNNNDINVPKKIKHGLCKSIDYKFSSYQHLLPGPEADYFYQSGFVTSTNEPHYNCANPYCHFKITERGIEERTRYGHMIRDPVTNEPYCTNCWSVLFQKLKPCSSKTK